MNGTKWKILFFAPVSRISLTDDRTKANIHERKRIAIAHAKFVLAENTHYFAHFPHNGFCDAPFARHYWAYDGMEFHARYNAYNGVIMTRHYFTYNCMAFVSRDTRYNAGDFGVSLLRVLLCVFCVALLYLYRRHFPPDSITDITARDFVRVISAITWWLLAYHYIDNHDAQLSSRYITYGVVCFGVRHMRFKLGAFHGALFAL